MTSNRQPTLIIFDDGSTEQLQPVNIAFYEQAARAFTAEAERLKQTIMLNPPTQATEEEPE